MQMTMFPHVSMCDMFVKNKLTSYILDHFKLAAKKHRYSGQHIFETIIILKVNTTT